MKKDTLRAVVVAVIALAIYHLVIFMIPFARKDVFWISYGFTLVAFAVVITAVYIAFMKNPDARSRFYGFPIARIGLIYGVAQLAISLVLMALGCWIPWWVAVILCALGLGAAIIGLISTKVVVEQIHAQDEKLKKDISLMRSLQSKLGQMAVQSDEVALKTLAEEFRYSDPVSSDAIAEAEADLVAAVNELQAAVVEGDNAMIRQLCAHTSALLGERNRLCKLNKH